jgi:predicted DNA-binding protein
MTEATTVAEPPKILRFRVPDELHQRLRTYAGSNDLSVAAAVRRLVQAGIRQHDAEDRLLSMVLATLVACEQTLLLLESFLPEGKVRSARLEEPAIRAAQLRLAQVALTGDEA